MKHRSRLSRISWFGSIVSPMLLGCMSYVPSVEDLRRATEPFRVMETNVRGVYGNSDVDSEIFTSFR